MNETFYDANLGRRPEGRAVAMLGYGNQGRAQALNMRDSGVGNVLVGKYPGRELGAGRIRRLLADANKGGRPGGRHLPHAGSRRGTAQPRRSGSLY